MSTTERWLQQQAIASSSHGHGAARALGILVSLRSSELSIKRPGSRSEKCKRQKGNGTKDGPIGEADSAEWGGWAVKLMWPLPRAVIRRGQIRLSFAGFILLETFAPQAAIVDRFSSQSSFHPPAASSAVANSPLPTSIFCCFGSVSVALSRSRPLASPTQSSCQHGPLRYFVCLFPTSFLRPSVQSCRGLGR